MISPGSSRVSEPPPKQPVLVTGATGALGRHLVPQLVRAGYQVRGHYRTHPGTCDAVDWRKMNFLDTLDFSSLVEGCGAVIHLAAETNNGPLMYRVNVESTAALLAAARSAGTRYFGYASSIVVYGSPTRRVVDETAPILDPSAPLIRQYRADPAMLEYARTKVLAETEINELRSSMIIDLYRPTVVIDLDEILSVGSWSLIRKLACAYRRTQYIYVKDVAAAMLHLMALGLRSPPDRSSIEVFNVADGDSGTFRDILRLAYKVTRDRRYKPHIGSAMNMALDLTKDALKYCDPHLRYALGMLRFCNAKLLSTGFRLPCGFKSALKLALGQTTPASIA
ncbi:MAG: NAD(P)-dependent oxidoreductase [Deltaproteobacteria bacterium]|nr:NAD(P)-dependent oxidoreductase [Deltaproteobacteria bacterium]